MADPVRADFRYQCLASLLVGNTDNAVWFGGGAGHQHGRRSCYLSCFDKTLGGTAHEAKVFAIAIQSVGMTAATFITIVMKTRMDWRLIRWASSGGLMDIAMGTLLLEPWLPADFIRLSFTMVESSFGLVMVFTQRHSSKRHILHPLWGHQERAIWLATGFTGGIISGLMGSGIDIFAFSVMVLLFQTCESISTPTSVALMAINAIAGFALHGLFLNDFVFPVREYWLTSVLIVVVGAPIGAVLCSYAQVITSQSFC